MGILSWIGQRLRLTDGAFWRLWYGSETAAGEPVTPDAAMKLSAWWGCVRLYAETISTLPFDLFETTRDGKEPRRDHDLFKLLRNPNADNTGAEFWEGQVAGLTIFGNAYAHRKYVGKRLVALEPLPLDTRPYRKESGELRYQFHDRGKQEELPEREVFHTRGFGFAGDMGLSRLAYARETLGTALATEKAAGRIFGKGLRAAGWLLSPTVLDANQRKQVRKNIIEPMEGGEAEGRVGILEAGFKFQPTNIPPKDAEMILSRRFNVEDIARFMGVPPILIGHSPEGQTMWGTGVETIMLAWYVLGLRSMIKRLEDSINKRLVAVEERGQIYAEINIDGLFRADSVTRNAIMVSQVQNGLRLRNECRRLDNQPPIEGGDIATIQSNLMPVSQLGRAGAGNDVRAMLRAWLAEGDDLEDPTKALRERPKLEVVK